jgi:uncharacterized cupin superfamily protein
MSEAFVVNVAEAQALSRPQGGTFARFEDPRDRFPDLGINIHVLEPGQPNAKYHSETVQEDFLVLAGECTLILSGEERRLGQWDFVHCPAGTEHVFVGAGSGPCWILMVGARKPDRTVDYPVDETAARYGASVTEPTDDPRVAYSDWSKDVEETKLPWPPG